jgi:hypothetical protein
MAQEKLEERMRKLEERMRTKINQAQLIGGEADGWLPRS